MYKKRTLEKAFLKACKQYPVVLVAGARQVGKTTFLKNLAEENRKYVTLDDPQIRQLAKDNPGLFFQNFPPPVLIDEIQYAPELLTYIKMAVDQGAKESSFWLTGSQQFHLMKGVSESLAGRVAIINMHGFSQAEINDRAEESSPFVPGQKLFDEFKENKVDFKLPEVFKSIWLGSFPKICINPDVDWQMFYSSYLQTYIQRDVRDLTNVGNESAFLTFVRAAAARTGQILNFSDLARDADISVNTAKLWLSILQSSGIVFLLEPYFNNLTKRLIKSPKLYFLDTGLACHLTGWTSSETLEAGSMSGAFFETWIVGQILKSFVHNGVAPMMYFYRDKDGREVDVVVERDGKIYPVEIKKTANPKKADAANFTALDRLGVERGMGAIICLYQSALQIDEKNWSVPVGVL